LRIPLHLYIQSSAIITQEFSLEKSHLTFLQTHKSMQTHLRKHPP